MVLMPCQRRGQWYVCLPWGKGVKSPILSFSKVAVRVLEILGSEHDPQEKQDGSFDDEAGHRSKPAIGVWVTSVYSSTRRDMGD